MMATRLRSNSLSLVLSAARDAAERVTNRFDGRGASADLAWLQVGLTTCMHELAPRGAGLDADQLANIADVLDTARLEVLAAPPMPRHSASVLTDIRAIEAGMFAARVAVDGLRAVVATATVGA